jgi:serine/threonine protein kinase/WD40 repeat protein
MTAGQDEDNRLGWLEALHEAVVADRDDDFSKGDSQASQAENFDALKDCLRQLEQARRAGNWNQRLPPKIDSQPEIGAPQRIGKFEILRTLGSGGQGIVFLAFDTDLRRQVALKVPKPEALISPDARRRFLREAHAAAGMSHPGIVTVHEIAEAFPACYLVSDYCPGGSLQQYLQQHSEPVSPRAAAQIVAELAAGVHYAHQHGVLHRDIKPSNVFLVERHEELAARADSDPLLRYVPKLGDFGLARLSENDGELTASGAMLGTPAYMAPEQAGGRMNEVCPATDVYGLGTVLYELLSGRPTFRGVTEADTLRQVLFVEPEPPRQFRPRVPRDLEAVCLRALEKDPRRRYSSAAALADDLHRYLQGHPTLVRPLTPVGKLWRAACRRPAIATLAALLSLAVLVASALFVTSAIEQRRLNAQLVEQRNTAEKHARDATDLAYAADMRFAYQAWRKNDISGLESLMGRYVPQPGQYDPRSVEWHYLQTQLLASSQRLVDLNGPGGCVQFSPDGRLLATGSYDGRIRIWEMPSAQLKWTIAEPPLVVVNSIAFSPDGKTLAVAGDGRQVLLCDLTTGKLVKSLRDAHAEWVADVDFSPDGEQLCSVDAGGMIVLWDWKRGTRRQSFRGHTQELRSVRFTQDGQHVITGGQEGIVQFWNLESQQVVASLMVDQVKSRSSAVWPRDIALSADRTRLAVCWDLGGLKLYDIANVAQPMLLESFPEEMGNQVHFLSDDRLAVGSRYGAGRIWTRGRQQADRELRGHRDKIVAVTSSPDGLTIATASKDGTVRLWPMDSETHGKELAVVTGKCHGLILSPNGKELLVELHEPRQIARLRIDTGEVHSEFSDLQGEPRAAAYMAEGHSLAVATDSTVRFYDRANGTADWDWTLPEPSPTGDAIDELWSTDNLLIVRVGHEVWAVDFITQALSWHRDLGEGLWDGTFSPDKRLIYVGDQIGKIHELRAADGATMRVFEGPDSPVMALCISSDGHLLLSAFENREIRLWDRSQGMVVRNLASQEHPLAAAKFTKDGRTVIAHYWSYLGFWHVSSGQRLLTTGPWGSHQIKWDLSPDERTIYLAAYQDGQTSIRALPLESEPTRSTAARIAPPHPD